MSQSDSVLSPVIKTSHTPGVAGSRDVRQTRTWNLFDSIDRPALVPREEALVVDDRADLRPAQVVESKLTRMLKDASLPVSHLQMRGMLRAR